MTCPKISIVTPSYNQGHFIEETIVSVLNQQYANLEYIIIDGGSTDNTIEIIKKYEKHLKFWISESDRGQAHGINKGLEHCTGEIFNWLNSDDYLEQGSLQKIADVFEDEKVQMVAGMVRNFSITQEEIVPNQNLSAKGLMCWKPGVKFVQPGAWMRRKLIQESGGIDEGLHFAFDWDLYIRYLYHFPVVKQIPELLVHFRLHPHSKTIAWSERFTSEQGQIIEKISNLPGYKRLYKACRYKMEKGKWTAFLSELSVKPSTFLQKCFMIISHMHLYKAVSLSRQTVGALKAFWQHRKI